ncbi:MAG: metal-dependent hydrolase [Nanoarchaeota archaeon]
MPQAVAHILIPILILSFIRDHILSNNKKAHFPLHYVLIAGIAGTIPDIDIVLSMILKLVGEQSWWIHKTFTHSLFFPLIFFMLFLILKPFHKKAKICTIGRHNLRLHLIALMISLGSLIHIFLDSIAGDQAYFFYPLSTKDFGINIFSILPFDHVLIAATLDGILLIIWLAYLEIKHKISDFI